MEKKVLSEIALYTGDVKMPTGFEIDKRFLALKSLEAGIYDKEFIHSKEWEKLNNYIREFIDLKFKIGLVNKSSWGNVYAPSETSIPLLNIDPVDLRNSPDFTLLYGVRVEDCMVRIHYTDNRRAGRSWDIPLTNNKFIMFPSTQMNYITNNQKTSLNFIQTITYEFV